MTKIANNAKYRRRRGSVIVESRSNMSLKTRDTDTNPASNSISSSTRNSFTDQVGIIASSAEVGSLESTPKEIFKIIPGIVTTKVYQNYYVDDIETDIQGRAKKEERHKIEQVKVLHKVARATGRINLSSCQADEEIIEVQAKKEQC